MDYTRDDFNNAITQIGSLDDIAKVRAELVTLQDNITGLFDENKQLTERADKLATDNEGLREVNNKLFLSISEKKKPEDTKETEPPENNLKYDDLFNEKGELK